MHWCGCACCVWWQWFICIKVLGVIEITRDIIMGNASIGVGEDGSSVESKTAVGLSKLLVSVGRAGSVRAKMWDMASPMVCEWESLPPAYAFVRDLLSFPWHSLLRLIIKRHALTLPVTNDQALALSSALVSSVTPIHPIWPQIHQAKWMSLLVVQELYIQWWIDVGALCHS